MTKRHTWLTVLSCALSATIGLTSCVQNDYDLSKDIDLNVTLGGQIGLPVGSTEQFKLASLLKLDDTDNIDTITAATARDGMNVGDYYFFTNSDNTSPAEKNSFKMDPVCVTLAHDDFESGLIDFAHVTGVGYKYITDIPNLNVDLKIENTDLTEEVVALSHIDSDDMYVTLGLSYIGNATELPEEITLLKNLTITFPTSVEMESCGYFTVGAQKNVATLNQDIIIQTNVSKDVQLHITRVNCDDAIPARKHFLKQANIQFDGQVMVEGSKAPSIGITLTKFKVKAEVHETDFNIKSATGEFEPKGGALSSSFKIGEMPDLLKDENTKILMTSPIIDFKVTCSSGSALEELSLKGVQVKSCYENDNFTTNLGDIVMSNNGTINHVTLTHTNCANLPLIINGKGKVPNSIDIDIATTHVKGTILPSTEYVIDYDFRAPLAFGNGSQLVYNDTINGWGSNIEDIKEIEGLTIHTVAQSTMPMDFAVDKVILVDKEKQPINELNVSFPQLVIKGATTGAAIESSLLIDVTCTDATKIKELDGMIIQLKASIDDDAHSGITFNEQRHGLAFKSINLKLKNGLTMDFNEM